MEKLTAVQWLALRYHHRQGYLSQDDIAEAKAMEKEQIKFTYNDGAEDMIADKYKAMEDYFNEKYNK
jgi:hypothetical protein